MVHPEVDLPERCLCTYTVLANAYSQKEHMSINTTHADTPFGQMQNITTLMVYAVRPSVHTEI